MIEIRPGRAEDWRAFRAVRLRALRAAPGAFGSTYAREVDFDEATWRTRAGSGALFLALDGVTVVGTATGYRDLDGPVGERLLVGMWVEPSHRGQGLAGRLVSAVSAWARDDGAVVLALDVAVGNQAARSAYERAGFVATGHVSPMPRDPGILEASMTLIL